MSKDYLAEVKTVQALVKDLDEQYRVAAFQAILLHRLLAARETSKVASSDAKRQEIPIDAPANPVKAFMDDPAVDVGDLSDLFAAPRLLLEKSLAVLRISREKFGIDGLLPEEVAKILTQKFRVPRVHGPNVRSELRKATAYVSRVSAGQGYKYLLMAEGERHLNETIDRLRN